jgi:hypothetical protein
LTFALVLALSCTVASAQDYDGRWWRSISQDERLGFLAGYTDCVVYESNRREFPKVSRYTTEPLITSYYARHPAEQNVPVGTVLMQIAHEAVVPEHPGAGESWPEKHGYFDGEFWRQIGPSGRLGFVSGYFECHRLEHVGSNVQPRCPTWYVAAISDWYGVRGDDPSEVRNDRVDTKIADVISALERTETGRATPAIP